MKYEVEQKFRVPDLGRLERLLSVRGIDVASPQEQSDTYFAHPSRDFATSDEALRIRRCQTENRLTYKGPKIDRHTKTRREIELPLPSGQAYVDQWTQLLEALGFRLVAVVHKRRRAADIPWQQRQIELCLDEVEGLGAFAELELLAEPEELDAAREAVGALAADLQLTQTERRSYLELLLDARP